MLDGSGGCRQNETLLSSGARAAGVAVATEGDGYTQACEQSGAIRRTYLDVHEPEPSCDGHTLDYKPGANLVVVPKPGPSGGLPRLRCLRVGARAQGHERVDVPEAQVLFPLLFNHGSWYTLPKYLVTLLFLLAGGFVGCAFVPVVCGAYFPLLVIF